jgi:small multidrug resistance family-3 protein
VNAVSGVSLLVYIAAAVAEIAGCFAFWAWLRLEKSAFWLVPGVASLVVFAWLLTMVPSHAAGRIFAAYGGIYITASLVWMWLAEGVVPDRWDIAGAIVCLVGASMILLAPRAI